MEEEDKIEEQPQNIEKENSQDVLGSSNQMQDVEPEISEAERGVPIGKFKNVDDLYEAYNNLQAEFTRKSQRLSALEKEKTNHGASNVELEKSLELFLSKNQEAVMYADELKNRVQNNESLSNSQDPYAEAWAGMLYEKLTSPNPKSEPLVKNFILKDENLKNLVIENYVQQLQNQNAPIIMSSGTGERVTKVVTPKPDTFEDAKRVVLDMFSKS